MDLLPKTIATLASIETDDDNDYVTAIVVIPKADTGPVDVGHLQDLQGRLAQGAVDSLLAPDRPEVIVFLDIDDDSSSPIRHGDDFDPIP